MSGKTLSAVVTYRGSPFSFADSERFASLAGDFNPMHTQPLIARRFGFGGTIVHGVHALLWSLDEILRDWPEQALQCKSISATFSSPIRVGDTIDLEADARPDEGALKLVIRSGGKLCQRITCRFESRGSEHWPLPIDQPAFSADVEDLGPEDAVDMGEVDLPRLDTDIAQSMFANLCARLPALQLAQVLTCTRIIGMRCPGVRALFAGLRLRFSVPASADVEAMQWQVKGIDSRFQLASIGLDGGAVSGTLEAFFRPPLVQQLDMQGAKSCVSAGEFSRPAGARDWRQSRSW